MKTVVVVVLCIGVCAVIIICSLLRAHAKFRQLMQGDQRAASEVQYLEFRGQGRVLRVDDADSVQALAAKMRAATRSGNRSGLTFSLSIRFKGIFQTVSTVAYIPEGAVAVMIAVPKSAFSARDPDYYEVTFSGESPADLLYLSQISSRGVKTQ